MRMTYASPVSSSPSCDDWQDTRSETKAAMQETIGPAGSKGRLSVKAAGEPTSHQAPRLLPDSAAEVASMNVALDEVGVCCSLQVQGPLVAMLAMLL